MCLKIKILRCSFSNQTNVSIFHPLEVVDRDSETQLQVGENLNKLTYRIRVNKLFFYLTSIFQSGPFDPMSHYRPMFYYTWSLILKYRLRCCMLGSCTHGRIRLMMGVWQFRIVSWVSYLRSS